MKITVFGLTLSSSWGNGHATPYRAIIRALARLGHQVHFFEKDVPYYSSRRDFDSCDYSRVAPTDKFRCDLSYMGTYSSDRQAKVDELLLEPSRRHPEKLFLLAGSLYPWNWEWPENVRRMEHVAPADHSSFYSSSRLTLNITRGEMAANGWCPSGRFFEAAACGTPLITDRWEGLDSFFDSHSQLRVVTSAEDVEAALSSPDDELQAMAARARQRTLDEHT